jgi:hypothetical protein
MDLRAHCLRHARTATAVATLFGVSAAVILPPSSADATDLLPAGRGSAAARPAVPSNYIARFDDAVHADLSKAGRSGKRSAPAANELAAEAALAERVPELHVERDEVSRLPVMVLSYEAGRPLAAPSNKVARSPEEAAREFLRANKALYGATDDDLASLSVRYVTSPEGGATIVKFDQYIDGVQLFDTELAVTLSKANEVYATGGRFYPGVATASKATTSFALNAPDVIVRAISDLTGRETQISDFSFVREAEGGYHVFEYVPDRNATDGKFLSHEIRVKQYLYPLGVGQYEPAYYMELWVEGNPSGSGPVFSYVLSANDGRLLFRNNLTARDAFTYRVYADTTAPFRPWDGPTGPVGTPHPTGTPDGYQAPFVAPNDVIVESLLGPTDPWLPPGALETNGNNTDAYLDIMGVNGFTPGDVRGAANGPNQFLYNYNHALEPSDATNRQAAAVGMFYQVNWMHDIWYRHGFTEVAGNGQASNYGRGGLEGDAVLAEGQDRSGTDNANMSTAADGGPSRMQMYIFRAGAPPDNRLTPNRDGTFDMLIVGHELTHYLSNRLIGNANGLVNNQGGSMGEGWGDFVAILHTAQPTDNLDGTYAVGGYTDLFWCNGSFVDNYYYSIRRYPYSTRKDRNPLTFKDIGPGITSYPGVLFDPCTSPTAQPSEVHNAGEVWANVLWEAYAGLAKAYGHARGHDKITQYMIDGMKLTPTSPTFTQARDGIIAAASAANAYANPKDTQILWQAFAKRGMGTFAVSPLANSFNHAGVVEDFTAEPALPNGTVGVAVGSAFFEQNIHFGGSANHSFVYGPSGSLPIMGNWDGGFGVGAPVADTPGVYIPATGGFFLRNENSPGPSHFNFTFGPAGAGFLPIAGDWDNDPFDGVGLYDPATGQFFLKNGAAPGPADAMFRFGPAGGGWLPIAGDWNGDGIDTIGIYHPATGQVFLKNSNSAGPADIAFRFGPAGGQYVPIAGDWNSDGIDTIGIYSPATGQFFLRNSNTPGVADEAFSFGPRNVGARPIAGNFDGQ